MVDNLGRRRWGAWEHGREHPCSLNKRLCTQNSQQVRSSSVPRFHFAAQCCMQRPPAAKILHAGPRREAGYQATVFPPRLPIPTPQQQPHRILLHGLLGQPISRSGKPPSGSMDEWTTGREGARQAKSAVQQDINRKWPGQAADWPSRLLTITETTSNLSTPYLHNQGLSQNMMAMSAKYTRHARIIPLCTIRCATTQMFSRTATRTTRKGRSLIWSLNRSRVPGRALRRISSDQHESIHARTIHSMPTHPAISTRPGARAGPIHPCSMSSLP